MLIFCCFFFFKQKTAYEMRISDWSSDVCSSDLFSVRMTNAGSHGWFSDREGYRYLPRHPATGQPWPPIPDALLALWRAVAGYAADPQCCLVNHYTPEARMGLHRDADEETFAAPRSEEHTSELQPLMRISSAVFCLKKKT